MSTQPPKQQDGMAELREQLAALKPHSEEQLSLGKLLSHKEIDAIMNVFQAHQTNLLDKLEAAIPDKDSPERAGNTDYVNGMHRGYNEALDQFTDLINKARKGEI